MNGILAIGFAVITASIVPMENLRFTSIIEQAYDNSCGTAVAASLLSFYWGVETTESALLEEVDQTENSQEGLSLATLAGLIRARGFGVGGFKFGLPELCQAVSIYGPAIAHLDDGDGHFVLVLGAISEGVIVGDPTDGVSVWSTSAFLRSWTGTALLVSHQELCLKRNDLQTVIAEKRERHQALLAWGRR